MGCCLDGVISPDVSRTETALALGEQLSNVQEYNIYFDDGNQVIAGLKSVEFVLKTLHYLLIQFHCHIK